MDIPPFVELLSRWPWWTWVLIGMGIFCIVTLEGAYRQIKQTTFSNNWIDDYKNRNNGRLPPIPEYLNELVVDYFKGMLVSKSIKLKNPSAQFWARLLPSERDQLLELVKWLGIDPRDYEEMIRRQSPPGEIPRIRWI